MLRTARPLSVLYLLLLVTLASARPALATIVVPLPPEALAEDADAIVTGRVTAIDGHWDPAQALIATTIRIAVDEVLKGEVADPEVEVTQVGGFVGGVGAWVEGSPEFEVGERVLVFLTEQPDGSVRVSHLYLGKYAVVNDPSSGEDVAVRDAKPRGVRVLPVPGAAGAPGQDVASLAELKVRIGKHARRARPGKRLSAARMKGNLAPAMSQAASSFTLFGDATRWFEPDTGQAVPVRTYASGEPLAPGQGFDQIRDALAAWSTVPGASLRLQDGGTTDAQGIIYDGENAISFRDPYRQIGSKAKNCSGVLAAGGHFYVGTTRVVNGVRFYKITEADLITNDGWAGCGFYENYDNFAEVITHEIGHMVGFDHSRDGDATMASRAHFDGRGASLRPSDKAGVVFVYPGSGGGDDGGGGGASFQLSVVRTGTGTGSVKSAPNGISCGSDCAEDYPAGTSVTLTATPAAGSSFTGWSGACSGTGACTVSMTEARAVTAAFGPAGRADLVVTAVSDPPATASPGARFAVTDTVRNAGSGPARSSRVRHHLSPADPSAGSEVRMKGGHGVPVLAAGQESTGRATLTIPKDTPAGTYRLVACADATSDVAEAQENNNCLASTGTITVALPDLRLAAVTGPTRVQRGKSAAVSDTAQNGGLVAAGRATTRYYLSASQDWTTSARALNGRRSVPALGPGAASTGGVTLGVPTSIAPGTYYLIACIKPERREGEATTDNNCLIAGQPLTVDP